MHKLVIKSRFRFFFRFWEKILIFDFQYGNRTSLMTCISKEEMTKFS